MRTPFILIAVFALALASLSCRGTAQMANTGVQSTASTTTTKLHFPQSWTDKPESFYGTQHIEVKKIPNSSSEEFFFRSLADGDRRYALRQLRYGANVFAVNFRNGPQVRTATHQEWESGSRIPTEWRHVFLKDVGESSKEIHYRQKRYSKVGQHWGPGMLSPTGRWLAVFSYSGVKQPPGFLGFGGGEPLVGDSFWQIFDTVTGEKVFDWEARNVNNPANLTDPVLWLEDRYFVFPDFKSAQDLNVVTLPPFTPEANPVTVQLSRRDATGQPLPPGTRHPVWIPLIPLTKEQIVKLTAWSEPEVSEIRLPRQQMPTELLLKVNEETENRRVNRPNGDGAGDYHYRLLNYYYFAVSLDNPTQIRVVNQEEWNRAHSLGRGRSEVSARPVGETVKGLLLPHHEFPKTGTKWGSPAVLGAGEWIAVFSYSGDVNSGGRMFVDVYEQRLGDKLLSAEFPVTVAPDELFRRALAVEGFIILPLNTSLDSFAFLRLP